MQINLFTCKAERNRINKTDYISNRFTMDGALRAQTSAMNLVIDVEKTNPVKYNYNYMYIAEFNRYYFIDDIESIRTGIWRIYASVDVLMSFRGDIEASRVIIEKAEDETNANMYLDDGSFVMDSRKYNKVKEFPYGLDQNGSYILICAGGHSNGNS